MNAVAPSLTDAALVPNIMHFARILRAAGLPIGPGRVIEGVRAVEAVGLGARADLYWALHAVFVNRHDQHDLFDHAFRLFWRDPKLMERVMQQMLPDSGAPPAEPEEQPNRRLMDAFDDGKPKERQRRDDEELVEQDFTLTFSADEILQSKDFEQMTAAEIAAAKRAIARIHLVHEEVRTRRHVASPAGARMDLRATLRAMARRGGDIVDFRWRDP
ncbi:MAG: VWA domain-containing protein, partial [Alphaproteobacteria bacterium]|nr:VWA domain-containing protein [Alphaproteobacteria bacterium]